MNFTAAAEELRRQEFSRLSAAVALRIEAFRSMTRDIFREEIATMLERLGHTLISCSGLRSSAPRPEIIAIPGPQSVRL